MGCDIHLYSETKKNGRWVADKATTFDPHMYVDEAYDDEGYPDMEYSYSGSRNYWLFGLLHPDVRTDWPWSFEINGFPEDASPEIDTCYERWDGDAHSPGHLTREQLQIKATELLIEADPDAKTLSGYLGQLIEGLPKCEDPNQQRIVFWFDN